MILKYDDEKKLYLVSLIIKDNHGKQVGEVLPLHTQRMALKSFANFERALIWGKAQGFSSVSFFHEWA